ncbi:MAG: hypothetical protein ACKPEA_04005, partial [Planctomycetota bacterium]
MLLAPKRLKLFHRIGIRVAGCTAPGRRIHRRWVSRHRLRANDGVLGFTLQAGDPLRQVRVLRPDRLLRRRAPIAAVQGIADAAHDAANKIPPGQSMTIDVGLQLGPPCRIIPKHPLQR